MCEDPGEAEKEGLCGQDQREKKENLEHCLTH